MRSVCVWCQRLGSRRTPPTHAMDGSSQRTNSAVAVEPRTCVIIETAICNHAMRSNLCALFVCASWVWPAMTRELRADVGTRGEQLEPLSPVFSQETGRGARRHCGTSREIRSRSGWRTAFACPWGGSSRRLRRHECGSTLHECGRGLCGDARSCYGSRQACRGAEQRLAASRQEARPHVLPQDSGG